MASDSNSKNNQFRVVLPVIFTFGASLVFFQGNAHADDTNVTANTAVTTTQTSDNQQSSNYQNANVALMTAQAVQTHAAEQTANTDPNKGAVDISAENAQNVANAPAVDTQPNVSTNQISNTQADPENGTASTIVSGTGNINTNGLSARNVQFLESIHQGAVDGWKQFGVLPSLTGAQAIIESGWGQSALTTQGHNLFGIKGSYNGQSVTMPTYEYYGGRYVQINDAFRAYPSNYESIVDHGRFLKENSRYSNLIGQKDYQTVTRLIRQDGYATDPQYTNTLNRVIQQYNLTAWDQEAFNDNINTGHIDNVSVQGDNLKVEGWHATNNYDQSMHHFIILLDGNTKQELYRQEVPGTYRQDVQNVYPNAKISGWGGFSLTVSNSANFAGKAIQVVSRYTKNTNGEPNGGDDLWFNSVNLNTNAGYLDNFNIDAATNTLNISGWHATDQSAGKDYHFIILYDATTHREIARKQVSNVSRPDVQRAYPNIANAGKSGFDVTFDFNRAAYAGHQLQVISRYSDANNGEGNRTDAWFAPTTVPSSNQGFLDSFVVKNGEVTVTGWQAANQSYNQKNHFVILYDATTHREIARQQVTNLDRPDVQKAYPSIYNSAKSGFKAAFKLDSSLIGHEIQVVSRYSDANNGEGNRTDFWFDAIKLPQNLY